MNPDAVRQPLLAAFATLLVFAVAAMVGKGGAVETSGMAMESVSLLGAWLYRAQVAWPVLSRITAGLLIFYAGTVLGRMTIRYGLYSVHTYLAMPLFGVLAAGLFVSEAYLTEYVASAFFVLSLRNYYACFRSGAYGFGPIFRGSLYLGVLPLLYAPALVLVLTLPLVFILFKRATREQLVALTGYVLPLAALCYIRWACGDALTGPAAELWEMFCRPAGFFLSRITLDSALMLGTTCFLFLCSAVCYFLDIYAAGSKSRSILRFTLALFVVTAGMFFLPSASASAAALLAVPAAVMLPLLFLRLSRPAALFLYAALAVAALARILF